MSTDLPRWLFAAPLSQTEIMQYHGSGARLPSEILPAEPAYNVKAHLAHVKQLHARYHLNTEEACEDHTIELLRSIFSPRYPDQLLDACYTLIFELYKDNDFFVPYFAELAIPSYLKRMEEAFTSTTRLAAADRIVKQFFSKLAQVFPESAYLDIDQFKTAPQVPLLTLLPQPKACVALCIAEFFAQRDDRGKYLFNSLHHKLFDNLIIASGYDPDSYKGQSLTAVPDYKGTTEEIAVAYLRDTPFLRLFADQIPFSIPRKAYSEHGAIFAPSGHGKTQLLQSLITGFLNEPDPPAMFILDSQGAMLRKIDRLACFAGHLKDRLVVLDPPEPALNFFQFDGSSTEVLELANYLFAALDRGLTAKQGTAIPFLLKLLKEIPGATLDTLREIMEDKPKSFEASPYYAIISGFDKRTQDFFRHQFYGPDMKATKQQVASRLYTILGNETFVQMFAARENRFSAYQAMQEKKIVLVNTSQRLLGETASSIFGRFIIAQVLAGAFQRDPEADNHLALLVLDEAFEYFDEKTERILSQARKYGVGLLFATQYLEQMPPGVKAAVNATTAIKMAGPVSHNDAMMLAREMYTTGEFLRSMRAVDRSHTEFACHVRNLTPQAVQLTIPYGVLEKQPTMDAVAHAAFRAANRAKHGALPVTATTPPQSIAAPATTSQATDSTVKTDDWSS